MTRRAKLIGVLAIVTATLLVPTDSAIADSCDGLTPTHTGTDDSDNMLGTPGDDVMVGLGGNDTINGMGGVDKICGGSGDDSITAAPGDKPGTVTIDPGLGSNTVNVTIGEASSSAEPGLLKIDLIFSSPYTAVLIDARDENGNYIGGDGSTVPGLAFPQYEVWMKPPDNGIWDGSAEVTLKGGVTGPDTEQIMVGADPALSGMLNLDASDFNFAGGTLTLNGGGGTDRIIGSETNDSISGNGSNDRLDGGPGTNTLDGGGGRDRCGNGLFADGMFGDCERRLSGAPLGSPIIAELEVPRTYYGITFAEDIDGRKFDYDWSGTDISCGRFKVVRGQPDNLRQWSHPQGRRPRRCPHKSPSHPGTIKVLVTDNLNWVVRCTYSGSLPGEGPPCQLVTKGRGF